MFVIAIIMEMFISSKNMCRSLCVVHSGVVVASGGVVVVYARDTVVRMCFVVVL
jgi:hypothetical protein